MLIGLETLPDWFLYAVIALSALVIGLAGTQLAKVSDELADRTGLGEALTGALLLGAATSLPGVIVSITAASANVTGLAVGNAVGGIAAQTVFLAVADLLYRRSNLEHAAASLGNLLQSTLLIILLSLPIVFWALPPTTLWGVYPGSLVLVLVYIGGLRIAKQASSLPMWRPETTQDTVKEEAETGLEAVTITKLAARFLGLALMTGATGFLLGRAALTLIARTGVDGTVFGVIVTGFATSLPELVTTIAAVRQGALTLAVSGIVGGNAFDVLFLSVSDVFYRDGSIFHAMEPKHLFLLATGIVMTAVLVLGLMRRERHGPLGIGLEGLLTLALYAATIGALASNLV